MHTYIVAYDLCPPGQAYSGLNQVLEAYGVNQMKILNTTWLVKSYESAETIHAKLSQHLDANDRCTVFELSLDNWCASMAASYRMPSAQQMKFWLES